MLTLQCDLFDFTNNVSPAHITNNCILIISAAQDLVGKLLQPDPQQRAKLDEVMKHPWITKDGLYPLHPYKAAPPDPSAQQAVSDVNVIVALSYWAE